MAGTFVPPRFPRPSLLSLSTLSATVIALPAESSHAPLLPLPRSTTSLLPIHNLLHSLFSIVTHPAPLPFRAHYMHTQLKARTLKPRRRRFALFKAALCPLVADFDCFQKMESTIMRRQKKQPPHTFHRANQKHHPQSISKKTLFCRVRQQTVCVCSLPSLLLPFAETIPHPNLCRAHCTGEALFSRSSLSPNLPLLSTLYMSVLPSPPHTTLFVIELSPL